MTILNVIELTTSHPIIKVLAAVFLIGAGLSFLGILITPIDKTGLGITYGVALALSVVGCIVVGVLDDNFTTPTGKVRYEVTVNDDTSFVEIIENYNIIEQRGEIFVLEEKNDE